ncbi:unnamed protein product [Adineta ricciae]|uniref:Fucosyltransferase n=1 Tax=Adineta ricciae TaxID=249248 RepID=A0A815T9X9_ADIRI|nr:unnamed protein product [Adineta ricciae]CAF1502897.1 unnamed protein product [Adineta ricciae]
MSQKNSHHYLSCTIYIFALIGFLSILQYLYENGRSFLPIVIPVYTHRLADRFLEKVSFPTENLFLEHVKQCPECLLFLFTNETSGEKHELFGVLNRIPKNSRAIFYPLTMKLYYNQPIRFYTILAENQTETIIRKQKFWVEQIKQFDEQIDPNSVLYTILESLQKPIETTLAHQSWSNQTKLILYYTKFFGNDYWYNKNHAEVYANDFNLNNCPLSVNACRITTDQKLFSESDASLIHLRESVNLRKLADLPRRSHQRLVFFLKESPVHSPSFSSKEHGGIFNYTQTYRPDSDVTSTTLRNLFWLFDYKIYPDYDFQSILKTKKPQKLLVAIISNCGGTSSRLKYIKELQQHISVDVFGKCGKTCPHVSDCRQYAYSAYKFYLSFENSLCDEYVTEKFFFALQSAQIVPVVLGWARYDHYMPSTGYIDVRNFSSARELAKYIDYLDKNNTAYLEYFQWRQYALHVKIPKYMCELCLKLFLDDRDHKQQLLERIGEYWNSKSQCHRYEKNQNDNWIMS